MQTNLQDHIPRQTRLPRPPNSLIPRSACFNFINLVARRTFHVASEDCPHRVPVHRAQSQSPSASATSCTRTSLAQVLTARCRHQSLLPLLRFALFCITRWPVVSRSASGFHCHGHLVAEASHAYAPMKRFGDYPSWQASDSRVSARLSALLFLDEFAPTSVYWFTVQQSEDSLHLSVR